MGWVLKGNADGLSIGVSDEGMHKIYLESCTSNVDAIDHTDKRRHKFRYRILEQAPIFVKIISHKEASLGFNPVNKASSVDWTKPFIDFSYDRYNYQLVLEVLLPNEHLKNIVSLFEKCLLNRSISYSIEFGFLGFRYQGFGASNLDSPTGFEFTDQLPETLPFHSSKFNAFIISEPNQVEQEEESPCTFGLDYEGDDKIFIEQVTEQVEIGDLNRIKELIKSKSITDEMLEDEIFERALSLSIDKGHKEILSYLLDSDPDFPTDALLGDAVYGRNLEIVNLLISRGAKSTPENQALAISLNNFAFDVADILVRNAVDLKHQINTCLASAQDCGELNVIKYLHEKIDGKV